jgi:hypothetical protein
LTKKEVANTTSRTCDLDNVHHVTRGQASTTAKKNGSFSLIERVILSAGAMLIFSVSFQIDQMPEGEIVVI